MDGRKEARMGEKKKKRTIQTNHPKNIETYGRKENKTKEKQIRERKREENRIQDENKKWK